MHQSFFKRTESIFLLAEAALRGWNALGRDAQSWYEAGIRLCFQENGITDGTVIDEYLAQTAAKDIDYVDPYNNENNIAVQALGQPNTGASRVFWDKQTETRGEQSPDNEFTLVIPVNF